MPVTLGQLITNKRSKGSETNLVSPSSVIPWQFSKARVFRGRPFKWSSPALLKAESSGSVYPCNITLNPLL